VKEISFALWVSDFATVDYLDEQWRIKDPKVFSLDDSSLTISTDLPIEYATEDEAESRKCQTFELYIDENGHCYELRLLEKPSFQEEFPNGVSLIVFAGTGTKRGATIVTTAVVTDPQGHPLPGLTNERRHAELRADQEKGPRTPGLLEHSRGEAPAGGPPEPAGGGKG
jgi:hypothetical protein